MWWGGRQVAVKIGTETTMGKGATQSWAWGLWEGRVVGQVGNSKVRLSGKVVKGEGEGRKKAAEAQNGRNRHGGRCNGRR